MPERWPQVCRVKITFKLILTICLVSTTTNSMKYLVNWIPLNTHVRSENTQPCLQGWPSRDAPSKLVQLWYKTWWSDENENPNRLSNKPSTTLAALNNTAERLCYTLTSPPVSGMTRPRTSIWVTSLSMLWRSAREHCDGADGARHAHEFYSSVRISYKFLISDCRGDSDLGLCSTWHLVNRMLQHIGRICFQKVNRCNSEPILALYSSMILARCQELHRRQACSPLQIDIIIRNLFPIAQHSLSRHLKARSADRNRTWNCVKKSIRSRLNWDSACARSCTHRDLKGGPEPLEKEIHKILGSKREDDFPTLFLNWYKNVSGSFFVPAATR